MDIVDSIVMAGAAAAEAAAYIEAQRNRDLQPYAEKKKGGNMPEKDSEDIRIGVYTCYCGGNISDVVRVRKSCKAFAEYAQCGRLAHRYVDVL